MPRLTKERLLAAAKVHTIFVHRFYWSHDERRRMARRLCADGLLVMVEKSREGFRYRAAEVEDKRAGAGA
jgi:hypothetical protein